VIIKDLKIPKKKKRFVHPSPRGGEKRSLQVLVFEEDWHFMSRAY
jgi:hypothetical protein